MLKNNRAAPSSLKVSPTRMLFVEKPKWPRDTVSRLVYLVRALFCRTGARVRRWTVAVCDAMPMSPPLRARSVFDSLFDLRLDVKTR